MCWWAFTGLTHLVIEGSFVFTPDFFRKENPNYFDEASMLISSRLARLSFPLSTLMNPFLTCCAVKEYSKGDSRYVGRDTATVTIEGITVLLAGPGSLLALYVSSSCL
jgi:cholestenol delta-isomerase